MNKNYKLVFFENFNDLNNWNFEIGSGLKNLWGIMRKNFILKKLAIFI